MGRQKSVNLCGRHTVVVAMRQCPSTRLSYTRSK
jgi:hypothetical protein